MERKDSFAFELQATTRRVCRGMIVTVSEIIFPERPEVSLDQSKEIIEKSADVFASWKHYDAMKQSPFSDASAREMLLNDLAELVVSCESIFVSLGYASAREEYECFYAILSKERLYELQIAAAKLYESQRECLSFASDKARLDLVDAVEQVKYCACFIVAALGVNDFTPYVQQATQLRDKTL